MPILNENIRILRKKNGWTQQELADRVGIKRSLVGAYEEGRAEPATQRLIKFSEVFNINVDDLIRGPIGENEPLQQPFKVLAITVDENEKENIELVPQKAAAGYLNGFSDPEYIKELPRFQLPFLDSNATHRAFEISGDSMLPLESGTVIIGKYAEQLEDIKNGKTYILVSKKEGVVFKRVFNYIEEKGILFLTADNKSYAPFELDPEDILEIWEARAYISLTFPDPGDQGAMSVAELSQLIVDMQKDIEGIKKAK